MTSALGGSVTAPKSQNGELGAEAARVVDVERAPAAGAALHAEHPGEAALGGAAGVVPRAAQREHDDGRVVDVGVVLVRELEREAARRRAPAGGRPSRRATSTSCRREPVARRARSRDASGRRPASSSAITASAVSQTGDWHASIRRPASSSIVKLSRPASARAITGWSSA